MGSTPAPSSLRRQCLHALATMLTGYGTGLAADSNGLLAGIAALPAELRQELLLMLAGWQLLDEAACAVLTHSDDGSGSSVLAGATALSLAGCVLLNRTSLGLFTGASQLLTLSLKGVLRLADSDVEQIARNCLSLRRMDLSKCPNLTAAAVAALTGCAWAPTQLQSLSLAGCWRVAELPGLHLCGALTALNLSGCWQLSDAVVQQVLAGTPLLEDLSLASCCQLTSNALVSDFFAEGHDIPVAAPAAAPAGLPPGPGLGVHQDAEPAAGAARRAAWGDVEEEADGFEQLDVAEQEEAEEEDEAFELCYPVDGVVLSKLRSLDVSSTEAGDCLLLWLAQRSCCCLQKLTLSGSLVTGLGVSALLAAKRAILHHQRCLATAQASTAQAEIQPLLELSAGGTAAFAVAGQQHLPPWNLVEASQRRWEAQQGGGLAVHLASMAHSAVDPPPSPPPLLLSLLAPPPDTLCPFCTAPHPSPAGTTDARLPFGLGAVAAPAAACWPPGSPAEVLAALGPAGLAQLQGLDLSGTGGVSGVADVIAAGCTSLQRLRLAGCTSLDDGSLSGVLRRLPLLRELDVSGCSGSSTSRPGSRLQRHKAARRQLGGITDASLCLLGSQHSGTSGASSVAPTAGLAGLAVLNASGLSISDPALCHLASLPSLTSLQLRGCKRASDSGLQQLLLHCTALARLDLARCSQVTTAGFGCYTPFAGQAAQQQQQQQQRQQQQQPGSAWGELPGHTLAWHGPRPPSGSGTGRGADLDLNSGCGSKAREECSAVEGEGNQEALAPGAFQGVVSTAAGIRLQRAALPKQACTRQVLAWLAGQAASSIVGRGSARCDHAGLAASSRGPAGASPLQRLELASCDALTEADLLALASCCPQLKSLQLGGGDNAAAAGSSLCAGLAASCRLVTRLDLGAASLADADLSVLLFGLPALQHLEVLQCRALTGAPFVQLASAVRGGTGGALLLRTLRLDGSSIEDPGVAALADSCPHLEVLGLRGNEERGGEAIAKEDYGLFVRFLHTASPYVAGHRGRTFVVTIPGEVVARKERLYPLLEDILLLHGLGVKLVVVCGAHAQVSEYLEARGRGRQLVGAYRVTDEVAMQGAIEAAGTTTTVVSAFLSKAPSIPVVRRHARSEGGQFQFAPAVQVVSGNYITAKRRGIVNGVDFGQMGQVRFVQRGAIEHQLAAGNLVLLTNIGVSSSGELLSCNAFDVATHAAVGLQADKLLIITGEDVRELNLPHYLPLDDAERMITASVCGGEQGCVLNSMEGLAHSEVAGTGSTGSTSSSNGSGTGSSSWYGSGGEQRPFSGGWEGSSWDGDLEFSSGGSGGVGGSGGGGGGAPWSSEGELELQQQQLQGSWSDAEAEQQGQQQSAAAVQQRRQRSSTAELALDLDSWQHVGYPIAVLAAVVACKNGVKRSHLIDAASDGAMLLEMYTRDGTPGVCMIAADIYEGIRPAEGRDVPGVQQLLGMLASEGFTLPFPPDDVSARLRNITVTEREGKVLACAVVCDLGECADGVRGAELGAFCVHPAYRRAGFGDSLLDYVEQEIRQKGYRRAAIVAGEGSYEWFAQRDFSRVGAADSSPLLPEWRRRELAAAAAGTRGAAVPQLLVKPIVELDESVAAQPGKRIGF
ncbi:hypothetical protein D9Q98_003646 [Chlorella vulgaris]|uniref:amino-acid N-acetyltransferase n=1 Tax=Chlorella vulgaris TaxID=3077 RepID=A0A9D4TT11_CHLVU|nr:hypothetical protein D9Q98_003646 [Chlorella vulgaris]